MTHYTYTDSDTDIGAEPSPNTDTMTHPEQYHIYQQLEPNDRLIVGSAKRYQPIKIEVLPPGPKKLSEREENEIQDAYLKLYNI